MLKQQQSHVVAPERSERMVAQGRFSDRKRQEWTPKPGVVVLIPSQAASPRGELQLMRGGAGAGGGAKGSHQPGGGGGGACPRNACVTPNVMTTNMRAFPFNMF